MDLRTAMVRAVQSHLQGRPGGAPSGSEILWHAFCELSAARSAGGAGPNPISYPEIEAWARLMRTPLEPHHVAILVAMDRAWLAHAFDREGGQKRISGTLSPAAFDAVT